MSLATDLKNLIGRPSALIPADDKALALMVLDILENNGISTMEMVLHLNEKRKAAAQQMDRDYWTALDFACGALVGLSRRVEDGKKPKTYMDDVLYHRESITIIVNALKMWLTNPESGGFSETSRWLLDKTLETFDLTMYLPGGPSYDWAVQYGHADYLRRLQNLKTARATAYTTPKKVATKCPPKKTARKKK